MSVSRGLHIALILACGSVVFLNTLDNAFHLDDLYRVVDNPGVETLTPLARHFVDPATMSSLDRITQFRPLLPLTLSINHAVAGHSLPGYHLTNLLFHLLAAILVYLLSLELLTHWRGPDPRGPRADLGALFTACVFAVHPLSGIVVNYISARDLTLMQLFLLGSFLGYVRMRRLGDSPGRWAGILVLLALSMLSKTNAVVAPLLVLLFEVFVARTAPRDVRAWLRVVPFAAVVLSYFAYTEWWLGFSDLSHVASEETGPLPYALTQLRLHTFHYLRNFIWPFLIRQAPLVSVARSALEPGVLTGAAVAAASLAVAWRWRKSSPLLAFGILAYWTLLLPTSSLLPFHQVAVDYRPYPSSAFLFLAVALVAGRLTRRIALVAGILVVAYLAAASIHLNTTWRTQESIWSHSLRHGGDELAHMNLAMSIADRSDPRVRTHLEEAIRLSPNYVLAYLNLGLNMIHNGETDAGLEQCRHAARLSPGWAQAHYWLSQAYSRVGRTPEAAESAVRAAALAPGNVAYQYWAARNLQWTGRYAESLGYLETVEGLRPGYERSRFLSAFGLQRVGRRDAAIASYRSFLKQEPDHHQAHFNLGFALMEAGDHVRAAGHFETTLRLAPGYAEATKHLQLCREKAAAGDGGR